MTSVPPDTLHPVPAVQRRLGDLGLTTVKELIASGRLRSVKINSRRFVVERDLVAFIEAL